MNCSRSLLMARLLKHILPDEPCPSALILGFINHTTYHVVVAFCPDPLRVVTGYIPEEEKWIEYRTRRDEK